MAKSKEESKELVPTSSTMGCPKCGQEMRKVSWQITAGAFDAGKEVEQTVYQCTKDKNFISVEVSTGNPSEFAGATFYDDGF